ncbi:hypothetical protein EZJ49_11655 [Bdellovibrio bacteriovorus]|uniref:HD domain-containing protein n=1 Tax=Bdellovibrio bacteriovorus TaxID=959 RepID=UPI0021D129BF|nr:HD domain-containing phosphohydrolase [Bdellovibrio bacteriovorus]UXR63726.1 hypothetical protein EZJ49_11655 [Bdellovibrio bacteriovorus]
MFRQKLELLILSGNERILNRAKNIVSRYFLTFQHLAFSELEKGVPSELMRAQLVLLDQQDSESLQDFAARVDQVLHALPRSRLVTVMAPSSSRENLAGTVNNRVTPLSQAEFFQTLKFEYLCLHRCRAQYFDIKISDLFPMTSVSFPVFIRLSLNQRYVAVTHSKSVLSDDRYQRVSAAGGVYILQKDSDKYAQYVANYYDTSGKGMRMRARAQFLVLYQASLSLNEILLFDFKSSSQESFAQAYESLQKAGEELLKVFESAEELWDLFRESLTGDFYCLWRAPWIAVYAALISKRSGQGNPVVVLMAGLLTDVGLFDVEEKLSRAYLLGEGGTLGDSSDLPQAFGYHPVLSLNRCLAKGVPVSEEIKTVMVCTHEQADGKGFPNQVPADKLPVEAQILMFAEKIDQAVLTTMQETGVGFRFLKEKLWEKENQKADVFSADFLAAIAESLI